MVKSTMVDFGSECVKVHVKFQSLYHSFNFARMSKQGKDMGENESDGHWLWWYELVRWSLGHLWDRGEPSGTTTQGICLIVGYPLTVYSIL